MKKLFVILILVAFALSGVAQQRNFDFSVTVESGQTLYFLKGFYGPQDVKVTSPNYGGNYSGYDKPTGDLVIPPTVTYNDTVYTITVIGDQAFTGCSGLTSVTLPNTLTYIGYHAFSNCSGIGGELVIPDGVSPIGSNAFKGCTSITSVVFGNNTYAIYDEAFYGCTSLEHISGLPETLTTMDESVFENCSNLTGTIVVPPHLTTISERVFYGCKITSVVISEGVQKIKNYAFYGCPLTSVQIPSSVTSISSWTAFWNSNSTIESIIVDEANPVYDSRGNCNALIKTASNALMMGCKNTIVPEGITTIGPWAFNSVGLDSIILPNTVDTIKHCAFRTCHSLSTVYLPSSVTYIGNEAFMECPLTTIVLPSSLTYIGDFAFQCESLTSITSKATIPPSASYKMSLGELFNSFMYVNPNIPIYIPYGTTEAYHNAECWGDYFSNFVESETNLEGEWYYEIENDNGSITNQHLECVGDTLIEREGKRPKVIVRSNTHYDRNEITEVTHEYVYEENGIVYWWNKDLQEFTTLYDLNANVGDEWEIKVGTDSITMHVDSLDYYEFEGRVFRIMHVSDEINLFSGDIVCGVGHLTSFFPERLMTRGKGYRVESLRCYWVDEELIFKYGEEDCDALYDKLHYGIDETPDDVAFAVYPNPASGVLFVETQSIASLPNPTYRINNLMGQTVLSGNIIDGTTPIDISYLTAGMYFISIGETTQKFVVQ